MHSEILSLTLNLPALYTFCTENAAARLPEFVPIFLIEKEMN